MADKKRFRPKKKPPEEFGKPPPGLDCPDEKNFKTCLNCKRAFCDHGRCPDVKE